MQRGIRKNRTLEKSEPRENVPLNNRDRFYARIRNFFQGEKRGLRDILMYQGWGGGNNNHAK